MTMILHLKYYQIIHIYSNKHPEKSYKWGVLRQNVGKFLYQTLNVLKAFSMALCHFFPSLKTERGQLLE